MAAPTVIERTLVTMTANATTNRAGQDWVQIEVQAVDAYDNLQDYVLAPTDGFQADILQPDNTLAMVALNRTWQVGDNGLMYALWVLNFLPLQASPESTYTFTIIWRNDTNEISVPSSAMIVPTIPGPPSSVNMKVNGITINITPCTSITCSTATSSYLKSISNRVCMHRRTDRF